MVWLSLALLGFCHRNWWINSLAPGRFQFHLREVIFKLNLVNGGWGISYEIALRWMPQDLTDNKSTLVHVMAWCHQATSHYLSQCWPRSMSPNGVTRLQWVNMEYSPLYFRVASLGQFGPWYLTDQDKWVVSWEEGLQLPSPIPGLEIIFKHISVFPKINSTSLIEIIRFESHHYFEAFLMWTYQSWYSSVLPNHPSTRLAVKGGWNIYDGYIF